MSPSSQNPPLPPNIDLQVDDSFVASVPSRRLVAAVAATLDHAGSPNGEVAVVISGDELLHQLNRDYRGIDSPTDVLSFPMHEDADSGGAFVTAPVASNYLGDVVISFPTAQRQAEAAGHSVVDELTLLAVHGVLHLLGYDHSTEQEEFDMWARQNAILASLAPQP